MVDYTANRNRLDRCDLPLCNVSCYFPSPRYCRRAENAIRSIGRSLNNNWVNGFAAESSRKTALMRLRRLPKDVRARLSPNALLRPIAIDRSLLQPRTILRYAHQVSFSTQMCNCFSFTNGGISITRDVHCQLT